MIEWILQIFSTFDVGAYLSTLLRNLNLIYDSINFGQFAKIALFLGVVTFCYVSLFLINDRIFEIYTSRRIKKHHLTITNHGNVPSIFLLRTIDLSKQLAVRFRVGSSPMIWVSLADKSDTEKQETQKQSVAAGAPVPAPEQAGGTGDSLIPNLEKPFSDSVNTVRKGVGQVSRKAGLISGIITSVTNLLPFLKNKKLQQAQESLKGFQQDTSNMIKSVNTKIGNFDTLTNQVNSVVKPGMMPMQSSGGMPSVPTLKSFPAASGISEAVIENPGNDTSFRMKKFIYDEDVWHQNIGKVDENGGSLNYAQSKILEPGESMRIDVELMNLSESSSPVSLLYKIEILQIPQTKMQLAAPKQQISGIVIYPKISELSRLLPASIMVILIVIVIQLVTGLSHLLF